MEGFVYQDVKDTTLNFGGRPFFFPRGVLVTLSDQEFVTADMRRRNDEDDPSPSATLTYTITGYEMAKKLMTRHHQARIGHGWWIGRKAPTKAEIEATEADAKRFKRGEIFEAKRERAERMAGMPGGRARFDDDILAFMTELGIKDDFYETGGIDSQILEKLTATAAAAAAKAVAETLVRK